MYVVQPNPLIMPEKIDADFEIIDRLNNSYSYSHTIMDPDLLPGGGGGNGIYTMSAMGGGLNPERYLSSESVETNSSTESNPNMGNIQHRKDHEFIPTRMKQINASKPAADPKQFTRVPSNPLLVSAQKQLMLVEEDKRAKELASKPKIKGGDDEPDWQNNLSTWKSRRRKQSEDALQRVSEVKALNDEDGEPQTRSIGRKLSNLLYTAPEDDWSDLGIERNPKSYESDSDRKKSDSKIRSSSRTSLVSTPLMEDSDSGSEFKDRPDEPPIVESKRSFSEAKLSSTVFKEVVPPVLQKFSSKADIQTEKKAETAGKIEVGSTVGVGLLNRKFSETALSDMKPVVTFTNKENSAPPVRRKSSELSNSMKSRLEAFISPQQTSLTDGREKPVDNTPEPDESFHEKLQTFRKISEGVKADDEPKKPKPPLTYSSLIGSNPSQWNHRTLPTMSDDDDDNLDKMLDDALEESYRSVLEEPDTKGESLKSQESFPKSKIEFFQVFKGEFLNSRKAPPSEKPPPPPPAEPILSKNQIARNQALDDEIDKQEQEIIASLENEEKVLKRYLETKKVSRGIPPVSHEESVPKKSITASEEIVPKKIISSVSQPQLPIAATNISQVVPKKRMSEDGNQKAYNNQHWLIQEAEQRRLADLNNKKSSISPSSSASSSVKCQSSPVYENLNHKTQTTASNSSYTNHQRPASTLAPQETNWVSHASKGTMYSQENLYANLGVVPALEGSPPLINRESLVNPSRLPGPQVPPRLHPDRPLTADGGKPGNNSERMLSVSGKKKCSHCKQELGRGAAMIIESLRLFYHLRCFQCCVCHLQLGNGTAGTDVRVRNNKLHCQNCYSNDEGLKFSKV